MKCKEKKVLLNHFKKGSLFQSFYSKVKPGYFTDIDANCQ